MEHISNHLQDLSYFNLNYTQEEQQMFIDLIAMLDYTGITIQYMNVPTEEINGKVVESTMKMLRNDIVVNDTPTCKIATTAQEMFDCIMNLDRDTFIYDNIMYIYKFTKVQTTNADNPFVYYIRIGKEIEWNEN